MAIEKRMTLTGPIEVSEMESDTITAPAATDLEIKARANYDIIMTTGDTSGAKKVLIKDSGAVEVASIDSNGVITGTVVNTPILNDADTDSLKVRGLVSTRNAADNSMYIPVATTSGYERGMKVAYAPVVNDGGYFDAFYANVKVASSSTPSGIVRAVEAKATIEGDMGANAEAHAILAKVNVSGASAEVSKAIGVEVVIEEESSGTVTEGIGIRVNGGAGVVSTGIDVSGVYDVGAIDLPYVDGNATVSIASLEAAFGTDNAKQGLIGLYQDNSDAVHLVVGNSATGKYQTVQLTACAA